MYYLINLAPPKVSLLSGGTPPKVLQKRPPLAVLKKHPPPQENHVPMYANIFMNRCYFFGNFRLNSLKKLQSHDSEFIVTFLDEIVIIVLDFDLVMILEMFKDVGMVVRNDTWTQQALVPFVLDQTRTIFCQIF